MARPQVRNVSAPSAIQGIASPVSTYVRPADPAPSPLHQLAQGLSAFDSGLGAFLNKRQKEKDGDDYQRGLAQVWRDNGEGAEEAVRRDLVPAQESPRFMEGLRTGQGNLAGIRLRNQFRREFLQWEGRTNGNPEAFGAFLTDFITKNVPADADPQFLKGLNPHIDALFEEGYSGFTKDTSTAVYNEGLRTDSASLTEVIRAHEEDGQASPSGIDYETIWTHALAIREEALKRGTVHADIDAYLVDTILQNAERSKDEGLLTILDKTLPGQDHPMAYGLEVQKKRDAAAEKIANAKARDEVETARQRKEAEEKLAGQVYAEVATIWSQNIDEEIPETVIRDLARVDPMARSKLVDLRKKMAEADGIEDKATIARIFADIHEGSATKRDIMAHFERGTIRSTETLNQALDRVDRMEKERSGGSGILSDATLKKWHTLFEGLTGTDPTNYFSNAGLSDDGMTAIHDFNMAILSWEAKNPQADFIERQEAINRIGNIIRQRIELDPGRFLGGRYNPEAAPGAAPEVAPTPPVTRTPQAPAIQPQPQAAPEIGLPDRSTSEQSGGLLDLVPNPLKSARAILETITGGGEEVEDAPAPQASTGPDEAGMPPLESLPEAERQAITSLAERHGVDLQTVQRDIWAKARQIMEEGEGEAGPGTGPDEAGIDPTTTNSIPEDIQQRLTDLLTNPPQLPDDAQARIPAAPILSLIGKTEGTDRGAGYNETLGYGAYTGGKVNLVGMTLDEVDALQTRMLRHKDNSWNSSAAGRYQIVRTTLRSLRKELGLSGSELYDAKMQDRLGMALLERRGLSRWQAGRMSDRQFLTNLAKEWASLPKPDGKGTYKGQRAAATPSQVLKSLKAGHKGA